MVSEIIDAVATDGQSTMVARMKCNGIRFGAMAVLGPHLAKAKTLKTPLR